VVTLNGGSLRSESLPDDGFSGSNSFAGSIFLGAAGSTISAQAGSDLILNGPINAGAFDLTVTGTGATVMNGAINGAASATMTKQGTGSLTLNGASTYGGGT